MFTIWNVFPQSFVLQLACGRYGFMFSVLAFKKNMPNYIELHLFSFPTLFQHDNNNDKRNSQSFFVFTIKKRFNYVSCYLFSILISNHLLQFQHFVFMSIFAYIFFFVLPSISFSFRRSRFLFSSILLFLRSYSSMLKFPRLYNRIRSKSRFKKMMPTKA